MKRQNVFAVLALGALAFAIAACETPGESLLGGGPGGPGGDNGPVVAPVGSGPAPPAPTSPPPDGSDAMPPSGPTTCLSVQKSYLGFGAVKLEAGRVDEAVGLNRRRVKPYSALVGEYARVLGESPQLLSSAGATLGQSVDRFATEPTASASSIFMSYRIAFEGCLTYAESDAKYADAPTSSSAATECAAMTRKFWSRTATSDEIATCTTVATADTTAETDPRRRWAYTCAAVLSAADFLTY